MKTLILFASFAFVSSCSHSPPAAQLAEAKQTISAWSQCHANDVCVLVPAECGQPKAINANLLELYQSYITGISNIVMCNGFVAQTWDSGLTGKCEEGSCSISKHTVKPDISKLDAEASRKVRQLYKDAEKSEATGAWMTCILRLQELHFLVESFLDSKMIFSSCKQMQMSAAHLKN